MTMPSHELPQPPVAADLPCEDGEPMDSPKHRAQMNILIESIQLAWEGRDFYAGGNMFLYFSELQAKRNDFRGPDFFLVLGTSPHDRKSWVVWAEEGQVPDVIVELVSESTAADDLGPKKAAYARLHVGWYYVFDPETGALHAFRLNYGARTYEPVAPLPSGRVPCDVAGLELGLRYGTHYGIGGPWLRWFERDGTLLPVGTEIAHQEREIAKKAHEIAVHERSRAEKAHEIAVHERSRAEEALARAERLEAQLRKSGVDPG